MEMTAIARLSFTESLADETSPAQTGDVLHPLGRGEAATRGPLNIDPTLLLPNASCFSTFEFQRLKMESESISTSSRGRIPSKMCRLYSYHHTFLTAR